MVMKSKEAVKEAAKETVEAEPSAVDSAIERLSKQTEVDSKPAPKGHAENYYIKYGKQLSQYEIDLDKRISVAGLLQAVVSSPLICGLKGTNSIEGSLEVIEKVARGVIEINKKLAEQK